MSPGFLLMLSFCAPTGEREVVLATREYSFELLRLEERDFSPEVLRRCAEEFQSRYRTVPYAKLLVGTGPEIQEYLGKGTPHVSPENYFFRLPLEIPSGLRTWARLAMVLKIGPSVLLRVRQDGKASEVTISGQNEDLPGKKKGLEILDFAPVYDAPDHLAGAEFFVRRKGDLRKVDLELLADALCSALPTFHYRIFARKDSWFLEHDQFPFLYAFDAGYDLPTPARYQQSREVWVNRDRCSKQ